MMPIYLFYLAALLLLGLAMAGYLSEHACGAALCGIVACLALVLLAGERLAVRPPDRPPLRVSEALATYRLAGGGQPARLR